VLVFFIHQHHVIFLVMKCSLSNLPSISLIAEKVNNAVSAAEDIHVYDDELTG